MSDGAKRILDVAVAALALAALGPLLALLAAAVRLTSRGPVLFRQLRLGKGGVPFEICKFRTMYTGCRDIRNPDGSAFTSGKDPRVTPVGRFLRSTSLDELPQLWNVIAGDMSLVGPRPDQVDQMRFYKPLEFRKLAVPPGITGLAQVRGRNQLAWEARKQLDADYVDSRSLWLDARLLAETVPCVLLRRGVNQTES